MEIAGSPVPGSTTSIVEGSALPNGVFTYVVRAVRSDDEGSVSPGSNAVTVTGLVPAPLAFQRTEAWLTTSASNRKFDLKAQVLRNGVVVAEKEMTGITVGLGSSFNKAVYQQIGPLLPAAPVSFGQQDTLGVRLSIRLSPDSGGGQSSAEVRLWYNAPGTNSRLQAMRAGTGIIYNLVTGFKLQTNPAQAPGGTQFVSVNMRQGEPYREIGTWSVTGP